MAKNKPPKKPASATNKGNAKGNGGKTDAKGNGKKK